MVPYVRAATEGKLDWYFHSILLATVTFDMVDPRYLPLTSCNYVSIAYLL